jgi:hypothetical protein
MRGSNLNIPLFLCQIIPCSQVPLSLIAAVPGTYTGPASRTYLYYTDEHKQWVDGMQVEIAPK